MPLVIPAERTERGEDGKTYYVPSTMTYKEWQKSFVDVDKSGLQKVGSNDTLDHMDITNEWIKKNKTGSVVEKQSYVVDGVEYKVDGKHVILKPSEKERAVAAFLSDQCGKQVELIPQIMYPQGTQTPDYLIDGERFDLKCFKSSGENVIYNLISKKKNQSPNFIFDMTDCPLSLEEIDRQISGVYSSTHTRFVNEIVVMKDGKIVKAYQRQ